jgi:hypothetical protein
MYLKEGDDVTTALQVEKWESLFRLSLEDRSEEDYRLVFLRPTKNESKILAENYPD